MPRATGHRHRDASSRPRSLRARPGRLATIACALLLVACSRTARPVEVPAALSAWPTVLETSRRDAWLDERVPASVERAWTVELGRGVLAPLAIQAGLLFATTIDRRLIVLDAADGRFYWERRLHGAAPAGAVFDRSAVFVGAQDREGAAEAYELARGFLLWRRDMAPPAGAPVLHDGITYWGTETGTVYALGSTDGSQLWRVDLDGAVTGSPVVDGPDLLIATNADTLYRVEMRTGRVTDRLALPATPSATGAFDGRYLHLPLHDTTYVVVDVKARSIVSTFDTRMAVRAMPVLDAGGAAWVLTEAGSVLRIRPDSMEVVAELGGAASESIALAANGVLVGRLDGALFFLDFDGNTVWREDMDDSIEAPVAIYEGRVYVPMLRGELTVLEAGS